MTLEEKVAEYQREIQRQNEVMLNFVKDNWSKFPRAVNAHGEYTESIRVVGNQFWTRDGQTWTAFRTLREWRLDRLKKLAEEVEIAQVEESKLKEAMVDVGLRLRHLGKEMERHNRMLGDSYKEDELLERMGLVPENLPEAVRKNLLFTHRYTINSPIRIQEKLRSQDRQ